MKIELYEEYEIEDGTSLICYEQTEKYSFLCPFTVSEKDESVTLDIMNTLVYSNNMPDETPITAIEQLTVTTQD